MLPRWWSFQLSSKHTRHSISCYTSNQEISHRYEHAHAQTHTHTHAHTHTHTHTHPHTHTHAHALCTHHMIITETHICKHCWMLRAACTGCAPGRDVCVHVCVFLATCMRHMYAPYVYAHRETHIHADQIYACTSIRMYIDAYIWSACRYENVTMFMHLACTHAYTCALVHLVTIMYRVR